MSGFNIESSMLIKNNNSEESETATDSVHPNNNARIIGYVLEPAVFLVFFARCWIDAVYQNQILYQTCLQSLQYNSTQCKPFLGIDPSFDKKIEIEVQEYAANIMMISCLMESFLPALVSLFLGPWSDKFGRRPILLAIFMGYFLSSIILNVITYITLNRNISPWWYLLYSIPSLFSGGNCALFFISFCYISDVTSTETRPIRMVLMEASLTAGGSIGNISSGYIYQMISSAPLFIISGFLMAVSLIYLYIWVPESLNPDYLHTSHHLQEFFRNNSFKDLWRTYRNSRGNSNSSIIGLTILALTIHAFAADGEGSVNYLFLREKFNWTVKDFSLFNAARLGFQIMGSSFVLVMIRRFLKLSIVSTTILCLGCVVLENAARSTAQYSFEIYIALALGMMRGILGPMGKTMLTEVTPSSEVGQILALSSSMQALTPSASVPLYTSVYKNTVENYPGLIYLISLGLNFVSYILIKVYIIYILSVSTNTLSAAETDVEF